MNITRNYFWRTAIFFALFICAARAPAIASASESTAAESIKLPYTAGQSFVVVQGYHSPPTHIGKDANAIDFSQNGCDAYGKAAVAASPGLVIVAEENGYNGGYGTQVLIDNGNHILTRYAHLIPGSIPLGIGAKVRQGQILGAIGDTGLVAGNACLAHPGTHLHFAMYYQNSDTSFAAYLPEPISNYSDITEGKWYLSDNTENISVSTPIVATSSSVTISQLATSSAPILANGGVSVDIPQSQGNAQLIAVETSSTESSTQSSMISSQSPTTTLVFNSSTLALDLAWQAPESASSSASGTAAYTYEVFKTGDAGVANNDDGKIAETTSTYFSYQLGDIDFGANDEFIVEADDGAGDVSTIATAEAETPDWFTVIQSVDDTNSNSSWYEDNWYNLGTGFYGLIRSLTLEGFIDNGTYKASHLWLDEYLDPNYTELNQTFTISDNAPFTAGLQKITIGNLDIPLQPNKYYRLRTYQDYQNRSVVLAGTTATGTAMWDAYIYGVGRVSYDYSFYPYLSAVMIPNYPPLMAPNPPSALTVGFDSFNSQINFSWPAATDPDTTSSLLMYEVNISTSTVLDAKSWQSVGKILSASSPVVFGDSYTIGVRAIDDLGNVGAPLTQAWNFPAGYSPTPEQLDHSTVLPGGAEKIVFLATTTVQGIAFWVHPSPGTSFCCSENFVSIHEDASGSIGSQFAASEPVRIGQFTPDAEWTYTFNPPVTVSPGAYWFSFDYGPTPLNGANIDGSVGDSYQDGSWSTAPGQDAYFRIEQAPSP